MGTYVAENETSLLEHGRLVVVVYPEAAEEEFVLVIRESALMPFY